VLGLLAALCLLAGRAEAQQQAQVDEAADLQRAHALLRERNRETMNPAENPLVVVGREQCGNDLRARTPALQQTDGTLITLVDTEEAYRRALALYEERASFHSPLPAASLPRPARTSPASKSRHGRAADTKPVIAAGWRWMTAVPSIALGMLTVVYLSRRLRNRAELAPSEAA
jgi:hypothetical protein